MTDQSLDITVSNPTVVVTPAQNSAVTINANDATVVVAESANQLTLSPTAIQTVEVYDPTQGLKFTTNPNNPFLSTATCNATVGNVVSIAGFCAITLRWITTGDSAHVNIYRATSTNFAHAERIGDSDEEAHTDTVEPGVAYTYWFEPVDYNGTTGPLSLPHSVTSGNNATGFVEALGDLTATHLSPELTNLLNQIIGDSAAEQAALRDGAISEQVIYINTQYGQLLQFVNQYKAEMNTADSSSLAQLETQSTFFATQTSALAQLLSTLSASVVTDIAAANAAITQEQTTRANEIEAVALTVTTLDSTFSTDLSATDARISSEAGTRANAVEAVASEVTQLETNFQTDLTSTRSLVTQEASTRSAENLALAQTVTQLTADLSTTENSVNASLSNQDSTLATLNSAVASTQQSLQANYDTLSAGITSEAQARASATSALSGTITSHTTQLGNMSTTVSETAQSVDGIEGEYGVKIDANGRVIGFGLINGPGVAAFDIVADNFSIANPDSPAIKDFYYDSVANTLKFRGQLILSNGTGGTYTVSDVSDIQAQDGTDGVDGYTPVHGTDYFDGVPGLAGSDGDSAYQSWVDEGNPGTTVDFLNALVGQDGENGSDGLPGTPGTDGITYYTWIKYADSADGTTGFSNVPTGKDYIGFAFNQTTSTESTNPVEYTWSLIRGTAGIDGTNGIDGINGVDGADGTPSYFHIAYGTSSAGANFSQSPTGKTYVGTYVDFTQTDSTDPTDYTWSLFVGVDGTNGLNGSDGIAGTNGADGATSYFHIAYGTSTSGSNFSQSPTGKTYVGTYVDTTQADSTNPAHYTWTKYVGEDGSNGTNGSDGSDGNNGSNGTDGSNGSNGTNGSDGSNGNNGSNGSNGTSGAGFYRYGTSNGAWPSTSTANSYLATAAGRSVVQDDVLTIYKTTNPTVGSTRRYTGSAWVTAALLIDGDMIATGTIMGDRIVANSLTVDTANITGDLAANRITTGSGASRIEIGNTAIKVYNNGALRVKIGLL